MAASITSILFSLSHFYHDQHNIFVLNHSCLQYVKDDLIFAGFCRITKLKGFHLAYYRISLRWKLCKYIFCCLRVMTKTLGECYEKYRHSTMYTVTIVSLSNENVDVSAVTNSNRKLQFLLDGRLLY